MTPARRRSERRGMEDPSDIIELTSVPDRPWRSSQPGDQVARLEEELEALEGFAARAAHELVGPLVAIEAYATSVLARVRAGEPLAVDDLERIGRIAARSRRLVESLLYSSRHQGDIESRPVDLGVTVAEAAAPLQTDAEERGTRIEIGELPTVCGDSVLLGSLFSNLIVNGLRYGRREGGRIRVHALREPSGEWRLMVDSDGAPLPAEDRERIFAPYERGSYERRARSAGLGLAICRDIVMRHGGRIGVSPIEGGNRFWLTLPPA